MTLKRLGKSISILAALMVALSASCDGSNSSLLATCGGILYAADGTSGNSGNLYVVDPEDGSTTTVGAIGYPVAAMVVTPFCQILATTAPNDPTAGINGSAGLLISIDPVTGEGTELAMTQDEDETPYRSIAGMAMNGTELFGWVSDAAKSAGDDRNNELITINPATGLIEAINDNDFGGSYEGNGLAFSPEGTLYATSYDGDNLLATINPDTGVATKIANLTQNSSTPEAVKGLVFIGDVLYAVELDRNATGASLVTVNTSTAVTTEVGSLPNAVQALAYAR